MRRQLALILALLLGTVVVATAQDDGPPPDPTPGKIEAAGDSPLPFAAIEEVNIPDLPLAPLSAAGTTCGEEGKEATPILSLPAGGVTTNGGQDIDINDPELSCMWGTPASIRGARTLWYKYVPKRSGVVQFNTRGSTYDTVLAIHKGTCSNLLEMACNDDNNYFDSQATVSVLAGETYYIEVADWHVSSSGSWYLNFAAIEVPFTSLWDLVYDGPGLFEQRSRHATAVVGNKIYIIGGQVTVGPGSERTFQTIVYNTNNGVWTSKADMPAGTDGLGYSNTSAAYLANQGSKGRIYLPSGDIGASVYDGTHWAYDIATNTWKGDQSLAKNNDQWAAGGPTIYSEATTYKWLDGTDGYFLSGGLTGIFPPKPPLTSTGWIAHDEVYYYSATSNDWDTKIIPPMPTGRFGHAAGLIHISGSDNLCVAGGMGEDAVTEGARFVLQRVECWDIDQGGDWYEVAPLNYERYFAGSAVDHAGNWYVFGGYDSFGEFVGVTERYDPDADIWIPLDVRFDLGVINSQNSIRPPRAWPRGGFIGQDLYAIGGETIGGQVLNLVERITLPDAKASYPANSYLPTFFVNPTFGLDDNTFATARFLFLNQAQRNQFISGLDDVDVFTFQVPSKRDVSVQLNNLNSTNEMNLILYSYDKAFVAMSNNPGTLPEVINKNLDAGQYFVVVERIFPPVGALPDTREYQILVQG